MTVLILIKIRAHQDTISNGRAGFDQAPNPDDGSLNIGLRDNAAVGDDGSIYLRAVHLAGGQESGMRINRVDVIEKIVWRNRVGEREVRFKKCAHGSDVLPISLENIGKNFVFFERSRNDMFAEIVVAVVERIDQNLAVENVDPHRALVEL